jgi:hypothetical protein
MIGGTIGMISIGIEESVENGTRHRRAGVEAGCLEYANQLVSNCTYWTGACKAKNVRQLVSSGLPARVLLV